MAPGGSIFKEVLESHVMSSDYETGKAKSEAKINSTLTKSTTVGLNGKNGTSSKNGVHDLLGCPVCNNLMYPPIHQVTCLQFPSFPRASLCFGKILFSNALLHT
jgi:E3 ubiquitin-protein ligase SIAH1